VGSFDQLHAAVLANLPGVERTALAHGRHLFVEKPQAPSREEARELRHLAQRQGLHLQVGMILR
jgi:predicted dehydrogenase